MAMTRRHLLGGVAAGGLVAAGIYELVDRFTPAPQRAVAGVLPQEQHLLDGVRMVSDNDVDVLVPPLHHSVVTARLRVGKSAADMREAREQFERAVRRLEQQFEPTPAGLGVTVAWGLPYFRRYVPAQAAIHLPIDLIGDRSFDRSE